MNGMTLVAWVVTRATVPRNWLWSFGSWGFGHDTIHPLPSMVQTPALIRTNDISSRQDFPVDSSIDSIVSTSCLLTLTCLIITIGKSLF